MTVTYLTDSIAVDQGSAFQLTNLGDSLVVAPGVDLSASQLTTVAGSGVGVDETALGCNVDNSGQIFGAAQGINVDIAITGATTVDNEETGSIIGGNQSLLIQNQLYYIVNHGAITSISSTGYGIVTSSEGEVFNYGTISAGTGIYTQDADANGTIDDYNYGSITGIQDAFIDVNEESSDNFLLVNYGSVTGDEEALDTGSSDNEKIVNAGTIQGALLFGFGDDVLQNSGAVSGKVSLLGSSGRVDNSGTISGDIAIGNGAGESVYNSGAISGNITLGSGAGESVTSTYGVVTGTITCGAGGDVVIAGNTGGVVTGGSGNDVLTANPTQTAANNAAKTTLDGGTGDNWLFGDGAYTTFDSGDNSAGTYNQIFGGASQMSGVAGYENNTVSYAGMSSAYESAYIDLLHGDTYMCTIAKASGAPKGDLVFEDYLKNVPNVVGSSGSDVIICDNGVDRITHGSGSGDVLYAGTGAGSQDTFVYTSLTQSPLANHDIVEGFKAGTDKIDLSALAMPTADVFLSYGGNGANTIYVEKNPAAGFNSTTDMIISVQASTHTALGYGDLIV